MFARGVKGMEAVEAAAAKAAKAVETVQVASANRATTAQINGVNRVTGAMNAAATVRKRIATEEAAHVDVGLYKLKVNAVKFQEQISRTTQSESDKRRKMLDAEARYQESSALGPAGRLSQVKRRALNEDQLNAAAYNRHMDAYHQRRIREIQEQRYGTKSAFVEAIEQATGLGTAMTLVGGTVAALAAIKTVVSGVATAFGDAKKAAEDMAKGAIDTLSAMREIASLRDKMAPDKSDLARYAEMRRASGLTKEEAIAVTEQLSDTMGTVDPKKLPESERAKIEIATAQRVARGGGRALAQPISQMTGIVADMVQAGPDGVVRAEAVDAMMDQIEEISKKGASSNAVAARTSIKLMTTLTSEGLRGQFKDPRKAVALNTIASKFALENSDEAAIEAVRAVSAWSKNRRGKGWVSSQTETLKAAGIEETDEPDVRLSKMFDYAKKTMGPKESFAGFMGKQGFRNQTENEQLGKFYNEWATGTFGRIMGWADRPLDETASARKTAAFQESPIGKYLIARASKEVRADELGMAGIPLATAKEMAEESILPEDKTVGGALKQGVTGWIGYLMSMGGTKKTGREMIIEYEARKQSEDAAGLTPPPLQGMQNKWGAGPDTVGTPFFAAFSALFQNNEEAVKALKQIAINTGSAATPVPIPVVRPDAAPIR